MCDRNQLSSDNSVPAFTHYQNRFKFEVFLIIIHPGPCIKYHILCCIMELVLDIIYITSNTLLHHAAYMLYFMAS